MHNTWPVPLKVMSTCCSVCHTCCVALQQWQITFLLFLTNGCMVRKFSKGIYSDVTRLMIQIQVTFHSCPRVFNRVCPSHKWPIIKRLTALTASAWISWILPRDLFIFKFQEYLNYILKVTGNWQVRLKKGSCCQVINHPMQYWNESDEWPWCHD